MPNDLPVGPDRAIFDRPSRAWVFQTKLPAIAGLGVRPEALVPPERHSAVAAARQSLDQRNRVRAKEAMDEVGRMFQTLGQMYERGREARPRGEGQKLPRGGGLLSGLLGSLAGRFVREGMEDLEPQTAEEERFRTGPAAEGWVQVTVAGEKKKGITPQQRAALERIAAPDGRLCATVLDAVREHYTANRDTIVKRLGGDELAPPLQRPEQIRDLLALRVVHIHEPVRGVCEIGFEFDCSWRDDLGVRERDGRVVAIGSGDKASHASDPDGVREAREAADPDAVLGPSAAKFSRGDDSWNFGDRFPELAVWRPDEEPELGEEEEDWDEFEQARASPLRVIGVSFTGGTKQGYAPEQLRTYEDIKRNEAEFAATVLRGLQEGYLELLGSAAPLPDDVFRPSSPQELRRWVLLEGVFVHAPGKDGVCEVGLCFRSPLDDEHGVGLRLRGREVVAYGGADEAFGESHMDEDGDGGE